MNLATTTNAQSMSGEDALNNIVVRSYTVIGSILGMGSSAVNVEAREALLPGNQLASQLVRIELTTGGDYPQTGIAVIESANIDKLLIAIEKLQLTNITTDRFQFTEVEYETSGLKIIVFNTDIGHLMVAVSADSVSIHFSSVSKLDELKTLVEAAKDHLERHRVD